MVWRLPSNHKNLKNYKCDLRDVEKINLKDVQAVIHLASIANDDMALINPELSWQTSLLGTYVLINHCIKNKIKKIHIRLIWKCIWNKKREKRYESLH